MDFTYSSLTEEWIPLRLLKSNLALIWTKATTKVGEIYPCCYYCFDDNFLKEAPILVTKIYEGEN